jgi:hypothetical protein
MSNPQRPGGPAQCARITIRRYFLPTIPPQHYYRDHSYHSFDAAGPTRGPPLNLYFGDPAPGTGKTLPITYEINGEEFAKKFTESEHLSIGAVTKVPTLDGPVKIVHASWGVPKKNADVTAKVQALVHDGVLDTTADAENFGEPTPYLEKALTLVFEIKGEQFTKRCGEHEQITLGTASEKKSSDTEQPTASDSPPPTPDASPTDFSVPCKAADTPTTLPAAPADPTQIERPEFSKIPKPLVKSIASVTSMMVVESADGEFSGRTSDIIATVDPASRSGDSATVSLVRKDGDAMMDTALEEAVHAVNLRYPLWEPGHINISFGEKFTAHGGPSAGTAFGIVMLSILEGFPIDPKCAVTGDITVDWKVRPVGGVTAKLRGATLDKCLYAAIPTDNEMAFADMGILYGHKSYWNIQVFSIDTLQDAVALARKDRASDLAQAIKLFAAMQTQLDADEAGTLAKPETVKTLQHILDLAPNHLSAKYVLALANNTASKTLSSNGTLHQLTVIYDPYRVILNSGKGITRDTLPTYVTTEARKRLEALSLIANKDLSPVIAAVTRFVIAMDSYAGHNISLNELRDYAQAVDARYADLGTDQNAMEKILHEGY